MTRLSVKLQNPMVEIKVSGRLGDLPFKRNQFGIFRKAQMNLVPFCEDRIEQRNHLVLPEKLVLLAVVVHCRVQGSVRLLLLLGLDLPVELDVPV